MRIGLLLTLALTGLLLAQSGSGIPGTFRWLKVYEYLEATEAYATLDSLYARACSLGTITIGVASVDSIDGRIATYETIEADTFNVNDSMHVAGNAGFDGLVTFDSLVTMNDTLNCNSSVLVQEILFTDSISGFSPIYFLDPVVFDSTVTLGDSITLNGVTIGEWPTGGGGDSSWASIQADTATIDSLLTVNSWAQLAGFTSSSDVRINNDDANLQLEATSGSPVLYFQDGNTDDTFGRVAYSTSSDVMYMKNDSSNLYVWLGDDGVIRFRHGSTDWATLVDSAFTTDSVDVRALRADTVYGSSPIQFMDEILADSVAPGLLRFSYNLGQDTSYTYSTNAGQDDEDWVGVLIPSASGAVVGSAEFTVDNWVGETKDWFAVIADVDGNILRASVDTVKITGTDTVMTWQFVPPYEVSVDTILVGLGSTVASHTDLNYGTTGDPGTGYWFKSGNTNLTSGYSPDPTRFPVMTVYNAGGERVYSGNTAWDASNSELDMPAIHPSAINTPMGPALTDTIVTAGGDSIMVSNGLIWKWVVGP